MFFVSSIFHAWFSEMVRFRVCFNSTLLFSDSSAPCESDGRVEPARWRGDFIRLHDWFQYGPSSSQTLACRANITPKSECFSDREFGLLIKLSLRTFVAYVLCTLSWMFSCLHWSFCCSVSHLDEVYLFTWSASILFWHPKLNIGRKEEIACFDQAIESHLLMIPLIS